ncbi:hypothetical protein ZWY2020_035265 [Hordeum vulgare]|nr:hypothetical protein ZWY2020_035265 [Hordeum vulgare]
MMGEIGLRKGRRGARVAQTIVDRGADAKAKRSGRFGWGWIVAGCVWAAGQIDRWWVLWGISSGSLAIGGTRAPSQSGALFPTLFFSFLPSFAGWLEHSTARHGGRDVAPSSSMQYVCMQTGQPRQEWER